MGLEADSCCHVSEEELLHCAVTLNPHEHPEMAHHTDSQPPSHKQLCFTLVSLPLIKSPSSRYRQLYLCIFYYSLSADKLQLVWQSRSGVICHANEAQAQALTFVMIGTGLSLG